MARGRQIGGYRSSDHAREQMRRRQIRDEDVAGVRACPEQRETVRTGREFLQSRRSSAEASGAYLLRVLVDVDREPPVVVTVYRTSKIATYWRTSR